MAKKGDLKRFCSEQVFPDDIVARLISGLEGNYLPKDPAIIHNAVFEMKQDQEFREILCDFSFDQSGLVPYSELLDKSLFILDASNLQTLNPRYEKCLITDETKKALYNNVQGKFLANQPTLTKMAKRFNELIMS